MEDVLASIATADAVAFSTEHHYPDLQVTTVVQQAGKKQPEGGKRPRISNNGAAAQDANNNNSNRREYYEWSHGAVHSLLDIYEEKYSALQRGNLRGRHWHEVAHHVSSREDGTKSAKTSKQCKMKIENLKRRYKMEKTQRLSNPALSIATRWPYYDRLDTMLGFTPKALAADTLSGSDPAASPSHAKSKGGHAFMEPQTLECEGESEMPVAAAAAAPAEGSRDDGEEQEEGGPLRKDSKTDASEVNTMLNVPGGSAGKDKIPVRSSMSNPGVLLANSITAFAEVLVRIEQAKMEMHKDLERQRTEADLKRTQMVLDNQLEIAKLVMKRRKRKGRSTASSSDSD